MTRYNTQSITSTSSHAAMMDVLHLSNSESSEGFDPFMQDMDFNGMPMFDGIASNLPLLPYTPSYELDSFSGTFDDPLSYQSGIFDSFLEADINDAEAAPPDLDNKLLGFGAPVHKAPLFDQAGQTWPRMTAELNGMFCVAEDVFEGDPDSGRPLELTCYRRNLFQISGAITISRTAVHVLVDQCKHVPLYDLVAVLSATESIEGKTAEVISIPWRTGNGTNAEEKSGTAPSEIQIDLSSNQETDPVFVTIPIAWGRLQFKYATANNGRRKGLQQHYRIQITLMAKLEGEAQPIKLAEIRSNPIVVRGRSPKNFDSSKDVHLSERRSENRARGSTSGSTPHAQWIEPALSHGSNKFYSQKTVQATESSGWLIQSPSTPSSKKPGSTSPSVQRRRPPVPQFESKAQDMTITSKPPTGLSLSDDDNPPPTIETSIALPSISGQGPKPNKISSPGEEVDLLYEYFPCSLDDWMPPVDAIYRPHVVHHLRLPPELKAQQVRTKPKRYFSADD